MDQHSGIDLRAIALLKELEAHRKDDGQGLTVTVTSGQESVELTITAKPSSGGFRRFVREETPSKTIQEMTQELMGLGFKSEEIKIEEAGDVAKITLPYKAELNETLKEKGYKWDFNEKIRKHPLRTAPTQAQRATAQAPKPVTTSQDAPDKLGMYSGEYRENIIQASKDFKIGLPQLIDMVESKVAEASNMITADGALTLVIKELKEKSQTPQPSKEQTEPPKQGTPVKLGRDNQINTFLEGMGLSSYDIEKFDIMMVEGKLVVKPKKFLGDEWGPYHETFKANRGTWIRETKNSRWEFEW